MNNEIIINKIDGELVVSSRQIADDFGKKHKHILESIRNLVDENLAVKFMFIESEFKNRGKLYPEYLLTRDGFTLIVMGFTGSKALEWKLKYIEAFNKMERMLRENTQPVLPRDYLSALKALVASEEEKELMKPKVAYYESTLRPDTYIKLLTSSEVAKDLGLSAQKLHTKLHELGIIYKQNKTWMLYSKYQDRVPEYCDYIINEHSQTLKWTEKGREWIIGLLKEDQYINEQKKNYLIG